MGRVAELRALDARCRENRLVTIVGAPGVGKTRLALHYALDERTRCRARGAVFFCRLANAGDANGMIAVVGGALGLDDDAVAQHDGRAVARALSAHGGALVVLDNVEPLLPEAADIVHEWLDAAPEVSFLATSRVPVGVIGEALLELGPLSAGTHGGEAALLLFERVRALRGGYHPGRDELATLAGIARALKGLPLALEVAASRLNSDEPREVLAVLSPPRARAPESATAGPAARHAPERALDRAWRLLPQWEREALAQCSLFRGGFTLEAAQQVVRLPWTTPVVEVVLSLQRRFLLRNDPVAPDRFSMCESLSNHAEEMLHLAGEATAVAWRHARYYLELVEPLVDGATRPMPALVAELVGERDNLQAVLDFGASVSRPDLVLRSAVALDALSRGGGLSPSQLARVDAALILPGVPMGPHLLGRALGARANALRCLGRLEEAENDAGIALDLAENTGDERQVAALHAVIGEVLFQRGRLDEAHERYRRVLELARARNEAPTEVAALQSLGGIHQSAGRGAEALASYQASLELAVSLGDWPGESRAATCLGSYWLERGQHDLAQAHYERGLSLAQRLDLRRGMCIVTAYLGVLHFDAGRLLEAEQAVSRAVAAARAAGDVRIEGIFEGIRGAVLASEDRVDDARTSFGLADRLLESNPFFRDVVAIHRGHLDLAEARAARAAGDGARAADAVRRARARIDAARSGVAARSDDARIAMRILARETSRFSFG